MDDFDARVEKVFHRLRRETDEIALTNPVITSYFHRLSAVVSKSLSDSIGGMDKDSYQAALDAARSYNKDVRDHELAVVEKKMPTASEEWGNVSKLYVLRIAEQLQHQRKDPRAKAGVRRE